MHEWIDLVNTHWKCLCPFAPNFKGTGEILKILFGELLASRALKSVGGWSWRLSARDVSLIWGFLGIWRSRFTWRNLDFFTSKCRRQWELLIELLRSKFRQQVQKLEKLGQGYGPVGFRTVARPLAVNRQDCLEISQTPVQGFFVTLATVDEISIWDQLWRSFYKENLHRFRNLSFGACSIELSKSQDLTCIKDVKIPD